MIRDKLEIETSLQKLSSVINHYLQSDIDAKTIADYRVDILDLSSGIVTYLDEHNSLTCWAKERIVDALSALDWNWFNLALNRLSLALSEENEISQSVQYKEEIIKLSADEIINHIYLLKRRLKLN